MHTEALSPSQLDILEGLKLVAPVGGFYLAGGTALALRFGHRRSIDFDFFRQDEFAELLQPLAWDDVRDFFMQESKRLLKNIIEGK